MHPDDKRRFQERAQRALSRHLSFEELKRRKEQARRRRTERAHRPPRRSVDPDEEDLGQVERPARPARAGRSPAPDPAAERVDEAPQAALETARVVALARTRATLARGAERLEAALPPGLALAVGDRVGFERRAGGIVLVRAVASRTSELSRPDPSGTGRLCLAANVELVCAVVAAREPRWKPGFVDRLWLAAEVGGARTVLVLNKLDLLPLEERAELEHELAPFVALGLEVRPVSATTGEGVAELAAALAGRTCVFVGPSGVGKSSLQNALDPVRGRGIGAVRSSDGKGRHTTSSSEWVELANGTVLIDTPGLRQLALGPLDPRALQAGFPELAEPARACRFRDCSHLVEPDCGVQAALAAGAIDRRRFASYARMRAELEERSQ